MTPKFFLVLTDLIMGCQSALLPMVINWSARLLGTRDSGLVFFCS